MSMKIQGAFSFKNIWFVQVIRLSADRSDFSYSIDSPDSSYLRFAFSFFDDVIE